MASLKDAQQLADDLEGLVGQLRKELQNGTVDFERLVAVADEISEHADRAAETFATVNETLMSRIKELVGRGSSSSSSSESRSKSGSRS
jgi:ABC-type transporter Mla subunit MlaD